MADEKTKSSWRKANAKYKKTDKGISARKRSTKKYREAHSELVKKRIDDWYTRNPGKKEEYVFRHRVARHGITTQKYEEMLQQQKNVCGMCGNPEEENNGFCIDHNHSCCPGPFSCGKCVCGIIHQKCNRGIGQLGDNPDNLLKAYEYVVKTRR